MIFSYCTSTLQVLPYGILYCLLYHIVMAVFLTVLYSTMPIQIQVQYSTPIQYQCAIIQFLGTVYFLQGAVHVRPEVHVTVAAAPVAAVPPPCSCTLLAGPSLGDGFTQLIYVIRR